MPNHVTNIINFTAKNKAELSNFLDLIAGDGEDIDFNKIIPMPKSLSIVDGSHKDYAIVAYLSNNGKRKCTPALCKKCSFYGVKNMFNTNWPEKVYEKTIKMIAENGKDHLYSFSASGSGEDPLMTLYDAGEIYVSNVDKFGSSTWYSWCVNNWNTKWNAYESSLSRDSDTSAELVFQTAWSAPRAVIDVMAEQHPEISLTHKWADEDVGSNCGYAKYKDGECVDEKEYDYQCNNEEATCFACEVLGIDPDFLDEEEE